MIRYSWDPSVQLTGQTVLSFFSNLNYDTIKPFLDTHGVTEVDPEAWYSLDEVLAIMTSIGRSSDASSNFVAIGLSAAELSPLTPEMEHMPFDKFLGLYTKIYPTRHRGGHAGRVIVEPMGNQHIAMIFEVPYPDGVMYGLMYGFARRILPAGTGFTVYYDEDTLRKDEGGYQTIIHIAWD